MRARIRGNAATGNKLAIQTEVPQAIETEVLPAIGIEVPVAIGTAGPPGIGRSRLQAASASIPVAASRLGPLIAARAAAIKAQVEIVLGTEASPVVEDLVTRAPLEAEAEGPVGAAPAAVASVALPAWAHRAAVVVVVHAGAAADAVDNEFVSREETLMRISRPNFATFSAIVNLFLMLAFCSLLSNLAWSQSAPPQKSSADSTVVQESFATPQFAADALIRAVTDYNVPELMKIFGPDGEDFVSSADPVQDKTLAEAFVRKAQEKHTVTIDPKNGSRATLSVGNDDWPFPVPIVRKARKWMFDSKQGHDEILFRRIGANELDAIQICRGFVEAQKEYASQVHDDSGINQYAQKIISSPGKQDGLYWQNADGTPGGPIGEAVARAIEEGYSTSQPSGYHGYYFKVLKGQGPAARLGQLDYVINGIMIGGFALVVVPAEYRVTGVKTFMVSYDGIVYEKDLGPNSLEIVKNMERYNPDKTWQASNAELDSDDSVAEN